MAGEFPSQARVVIIGGGVAGCSVAYHLAELGWTDIVLLERKQLTCGTTWHAAGLIGQGRGSPVHQKMAMYSADLYERLEQDVGISTGLKRNGSMLIAKSDEKVHEVRHLAAAVNMNGLDAHILTPQECVEKYPYLNVDDVQLGMFIPRDGQADPANVTQAMAKGAREKGAKIIQGVKVTGISQAKGAVTGVETDRGTIQADYVVNCAGMWGREVGQMAGVDIPLHACEHFYIVTEPIDGLPGNLPVLRVQEESAYYKEDAGKILLGAFEPVAKPWGGDGIPQDFEFDQLPEDFEHFEPILEQAINRLPMLETAGIHTFFNGPESFTPDDNWMMGEAPNLKNFFVMCGFNSIGIVSSGGVGRELARWMDTGAPQEDLWNVDVRRMFGFQNNKSYLQARVTETLGLLYADHYPYRQFASARGVRRTPLHGHMKELGACFGELGGWERPNWFVKPDERGSVSEPTYEYSWKRQNWFGNAAEEHNAIRENVGFFDMSSFGKIRVEGPDAEAVLQRVCGADVAVPAGKIVYTQWLNDRAGVEADVTVTRLSETVFLVITPAATIGKEMNWLRRHIPDDARCIATDVTAGEAAIAVMGPNARNVLGACTPADLGNDVFPFGTARDVEFGFGMARAHRVTYVGELGWEIYVGADMAGHVFETLWDAGQQYGMRPCGMHVLDSCRIEKAFRHYGHDITDDDNVLHAGLGFAVKVDKEQSRFGDFVGRDAVLRTKQHGLTKRMLQFRLEDPEPLLYHHEPLYRDGNRAGYITSGNYGHHLGGAVGLGYVDCAPEEKFGDLLTSTFEIEVDGKRLPAIASAKPMYDPKSERVRA
ncbi:MAG: FAD-dependent oxidoreductase [Pseudomonadota bacterium]